MKYSVELTDTFGGEANYAWVRRKTITVLPNATRRTIIRKAKSALGLSARHYVEDYGDSITLRWPNACMVAFITYEED